MTGGNGNAQVVEAGTVKSMPGISMAVGASLEIARFCAEDKLVAQQFCKEAHEESIFGEIEFSESKFSKFFEKAITAPDYHLGLKATLDGEVLGILYCYRGGYFVGEGARVASVSVINVKKPLRTTLLGGKVAIKLVRAAVSWAKSWDANVVLFYVTSGEAIGRTDRFFRKAGMTTLGGNYGIRL